MKEESKEEYLAIPLRQDIEVLPADEPKQLKLGWTVWERPGIMINAFKKRTYAICG